MDRSYVEVNRASLERLRALVEGATDSELANPMEGGWTVASVLAHAAFWDLRIVALLDAWDGSRPLPPYHEDAVDWINDSAKPIIMALEPRAAARVALEAAEAADRAVAEMSDDLLAANEASGEQINVVRAEHRQEHLDEVEAALSRA
jgi:hypothetical protein